MVILSLITGFLGVSAFMAKRTLNKKLESLRAIYGDDYNVCELIADKAEDMLLGSGGAIFYAEWL